MAKRVRDTELDMQPMMKNIRTITSTCHQELRAGKLTHLSIPADPIALMMAASRAVGMERTALRYALSCSQAPNRQGKRGGDRHLHLGVLPLQVRLSIIMRMLRHHTTTQ